MAPRNVYMLKCVLLNRIFPGFHSCCFSAARPGFTEFFLFSFIFFFILPGFLRCLWPELVWVRTVYTNSVCYWVLFGRVLGFFFVVSLRNRLGYRWRHPTEFGCILLIFSINYFCYWRLNFKCRSSNQPSSADVLPSFFFKFYLIFRRLNQFRVVWVCYRRVSPSFTGFLVLFCGLAFRSETDSFLQDSFTVTRWKLGNNSVQSRPASSLVGQSIGHAPLAWTWKANANRCRFIAAEKAAGIANVETISVTIHQNSGKPIKTQ